MNKTKQELAEEHAKDLWGNIENERYYFEKEGYYSPHTFGELGKISFLEGFAAAAEPKWISVNDQEPEFGIPVLVWCEIYGRYIATFEFIGEAFGQKWGNWHDGKSLGVLPPKFWMPLPSPPKQ